MNHIEIPRPDDWHIHFREGDILSRTLGFASRCFNRCVAMPNLSQPLINAELVASYGTQLARNLPTNSKLQPLLTLYLTEQTNSKELKKAADIDNFFAVKWYPAGTTMHSAAGVADISKCYEVLEAMEKLDIPLLVHGESAVPADDVFDRERIFLEKEFLMVRERFPRLRITLEHISTKEAVAYLRSSSNRTAATLTPHHIKYNRNDMLAVHLNPHLYCKPVLKTEQDRLALCDLVLSGFARLFLGSDSAPHTRERKESSCGCAGVFSSPFLIEIYTEIFAELGALTQLANFSSRNGAQFYGFPPTTEKIRIARRECRVPTSIGDFVPMAAGETLSWNLVK